MEVAHAHSGSWSTIASPTGIWKCWLVCWLSIQQEFRFKISETSRAEWNGRFRLHRPDPSHRAFGYCSWKQDTKERYCLGTTILSNGKEYFGLTDWNDQTSQRGHLQSWSRKFRSDQTEMSGILCWMESAVSSMVLCWVVVWRLDCIGKQPLISLAITMWREKVGQDPCPENRPIVQFDTTPTQSQA